MRKESPSNGEYYHVFNRGVDKRTVFLDQNDFRRFFQSMEEFNAIKPIGSIYENSFHKDKKDQLGQLGSSTSKQDKLVNFICYCLNPNHYHFILEQVVNRGIEKFMHRLGTGYTKYFNKKNKRNGVLFQGRYKINCICSNEDLLYLSAYVNLNDKVHRLGSSTSKSSYGEYFNVDNHEDRGIFCKKDIILKQFKDQFEYKKFAEGSLEEIKAIRDFRNVLLE
ncbi:transposase [Patescibacteria group bacterium]|nr:transposase [Patescibacteria group bacterium]